MEDMIRVEIEIPAAEIAKRIRDAILGDSRSYETTPLVAATSEAVRLTMPTIERLLLDLLRAELASPQFREAATAAIRAAAAEGIGAEVKRAAKARTRRLGDALLFEESAE